MKKLLIGTLGLGLVIGAFGMNVFANDNTSVSDQIYNNSVATISADQDNAQNNAQFETLYQKADKIETLDSSQYTNGQNNKNQYQYRNNQGYNNNNGNYRGDCNGAGNCRR